MTDPFTPDQIDQMTNEINQQLQDLGTLQAAPLRAGQPARPRAAKQRAVIETATGQDATTFLARFRQAARKDLCEDGGVLHGQWMMFKDLVSKDMLNTSKGILIGLGISANTLAMVTVAVAVYVLHLGAEAFCAGEE